MTEQDILNQLTRILRDLLSDDSIVLTMETTRPEVAGWDSFAYINFVVQVETEYRIKFRVADVESFQNVGEIVRGIAALLPAPQQRAG